MTGKGILLLAGVLSLAAPAQAQAQPRASREPSPIEVLAGANDASRQRPSSEGFEAARQIYHYQAGAIFELYANPSFVSTILLEPGETLVNIAAGDTARWLVTQAEGASGGEAQTIVLVKPALAGLRTNIVLITDRRTYVIEAVSQAGRAYAAEIAWSYAPTPRGPTAAPLDGINLGYEITTVRGRRPAWLPVRVFDDGRRTFVEFAPEVAASDLPPLFIVTGEGAELVNYRIAAGANGQRYEVDRVFDVGELRLGTRAPIIVRIVRIQNSDARQLRRQRSGRR